MPDVRKTLEVLLVDENRMGPAFNQAERQVAGFASRASASMARVGRAIMSIQGLMASAGFVYGAKSLFEDALSNETAVAQLETVLKSTQRARALIQGLQQDAASTPLQLADMRDWAVRLLNVGVGYSEVRDEIRMLGDAGAGQSMKIERLVNAYTKLRTKGKATMEELNLFLEAGVPILDALASRLNVATTAVAEMVSRGEVGFEDVRDALVGLTSEGGLYYQMMEKMSQTTEGRISTMVDNWKLLKQEIADQALPALNDSIQQTIGLLEQLRNTNVPAELGRNIADIVGAIAQVGGMRSLLPEGAGQMMPFTGLGQLRLIAQTLGTLSAGGSLADAMAPFAPADLSVAQEAQEMLRQKAEEMAEKNALAQQEQALTEKQSEELRRLKKELADLEERQNRDLVQKALQSEQEAAKAKAKAAGEAADVLRRASDEASAQARDAWARLLMPEGQRRAAEEAEAARREREAEVMKLVERAQAKMAQKADLQAKGLTGSASKITLRPEEQEALSAFQKREQAEELRRQADVKEAEASGLETEVASLSEAITALKEGWKAEELAQKLGALTTAIGTLEQTLQPQEKEAAGEEDKPGPPEQDLPAHAPDEKLGDRVDTALALTPDASLGSLRENLYGQLGLHSKEAEVGSLMGLGREAIMGGWGQVGQPGNAGATEADKQTTLLDKIAKTIEKVLGMGA